MHPIRWIRRLLGLPETVRLETLHGPEAASFWRSMGVEVTDDGFPKGVTMDGPPTQCMACGQLTEAGEMCAFGCPSGLMHEGALCQDCIRLRWTQPEEFMAKIRQQLDIDIE